MRSSKKKKGIIQKNNNICNMSVKIRIVVEPFIFAFVHAFGIFFVIDSQSAF